MSDSDETESENNAERFEYLSLSCPRVSEFVIRSKKNYEKEICQRGNVEVLTEFFSILESSEIEELKFHILEIHPKDLKIFDENLEKNCSYQVEWIIFNQSVHPQLMIDFALKCPNLEYLLTRGYNLKYPCNKTDYVIRVPAHCCDLPASLVKKTQIPLMCQPIQWSYQERNQFLTEKLPEQLFHSEFITECEFFFNEANCDQREHDPFPNENHRRIEITCKADYVYLKIECCPREQNVGLYKLCIHQNCRMPLSGERLFRRGISFLQSAEEWDAVDPNQKTLIDMPLTLVEEILENLTFKQKLPVRNTCRRLHSLFHSRKYLISKAILPECGYLIVNGEKARSSCPEAKHLFGKMLFEVGKFETLEIGLPIQQWEQLLEETANLEPMRIDNLIITRFGMKKVLTTMKFLVEKCQSPLKSIVLSGAVYLDWTEYGDFLQKIMSIEKVRIDSLFWKGSWDALDVFIEKSTKADSKIGSILEMKFAKNAIPLEEIRTKFEKTKLFTYSVGVCNAVCIPTENPMKRILIQYNSDQVYSQIVSAELDTKDYVIEGMRTLEEESDTEYSDSDDDYRLNFWRRDSSASDDDDDDNNDEENDDEDNEDDF